MFGKLVAITQNTFIETIRQPIYGILMWSAFGLLALNPSIAAFSLESGSDSKIMTDIGLATMLLYGLFASVFSAAGVITREIESYTALTVISKPVSRPLFLVGKFCGVGGAMLIAYYFLMIVFMMTVRHGVMETSGDTYDWPVLFFGISAVLVSLIAATFGNYVYGWHFSATLTAWVVPLGTLALFGTLFFDRGWNPQPPSTDFGDFQIVFAVLAIICAVLILTAFAVALSTQFGQIPTLIGCAAIYMVGLLSDYYLGPNNSKGVLYDLAYHVVPNFQFFWFSDALTQDLLITPAQIGNVAAYAALYILAVLSLGVALFQTREVG